jgi:hypothetical protein
MENDFQTHDEATSYHDAMTARVLGGDSEKIMM